MMSIRMGMMARVIFALLSAARATIHVRVDGDALVAETLREYASVDLDWWPDTGLEAGSWARASVLTANLSSPRLRAAARKLAPGLLRVGGSLDVEARYAFDEADRAWCEAPHAFRGSNVTLCLDRARYDAVHAFAADAGLGLVWGLNFPGAYASTGALGDSASVPAWDGASALQLLNHSFATGRALYAVEVAEELVPAPKSPSFAHLKGAYAAVRSYVERNAPKHEKPLVLGPCVGMAAETDGDAACDPTCEPSPFFDAFLEDVLPLVDAVCMHSYNNDGPWPAPGFVSQTERQYAALARAVGGRAEVWCGECGPHNGGGLANVTDAVESMFWYADALGALAAAGAPEFGRQSLAGGDYGLLDAARDYYPNPDYHVARLWTETMGRGVLRAFSSSDDVHAYAHCSPGGGASLALVNPGAAVDVDVGLGGARAEWVLTGEFRDVSLNGVALDVPEGDVPDLLPRTATGPLALPARSVAFLRYPDAAVPACAS